MKYFFSFLFGLFYLHGGAQSLLSVKDGLSNRWVTHIAQDKSGFIWIGTINGLNRYDGYSFNQYITPQLSNHKINGVHVDDSGYIWIATYNGVNVSVQPGGSVFRVLKQTIGKEIICFYKTGDGKILISDDKGVIYQLTNTDLLPLIHCPLRKPGSPQIASYVNSILEDVNHRVWFSTTSGEIYCYANKVLTEITTDSIKRFHPRAFVLNQKRHEVTIATQYGGLIKTDYFGMVICDSVYTRLSYMESQINSLFQENANSLWICCNQGKLLHLNPESKTITDYSDKISAENSGAHIHTLFIDQTGLVWIGTGNGVIRFRRDIPFLKTYFKDPEKVSFRGLTEDGHRHFYFSSYAGMFYCDSAFHVIKKIYIKGNTTTNPIPYIRGMCGYEGKIWCALENGPLGYIDEKTKEFHHTPFEKGSDRFPTEGYHSILRLGDQLLLGTPKGIYAYSISSQRITKLYYGGLPDNDIYCLKQLADGSVVAGTGNGIYILQSGKVIKQYSVFSKPPIPSNQITCLSVFNHQLYAGSSNGLIVISLLTDEMEVYKTENGLSNNFINSIEIDQQGVCWIATDNGICRFDQRHNSIQVVSGRHALQATEFNRFSSLQCSNHDILFGSVDGLVRFSPQSYIESDHPLPSLFLNSFTAHKYDTDTIINLQAHNNKYTINADERFIEITFALACYENPEANRFYYQLNGLSDNWIPLGNKHSIVLMNLPAGNYQLNIKAKDAESVAGDALLTIPIEVKQALYKSFGFQLLLAVLIILSFYLLYLMRMRSLLKIQFIRTQIASDLHDEVGGLLTRISIQSELLGREEQMSETQLENLDKISQNSKKAIEMMSDVLWSIDARSDTIGNLIDRMLESLPVLDDLKIKYELEVKIPDKGIRLQSDRRQHIYLIFKEAITNISKHSNATLVNISFKMKNGKFDMMIKDNGTTKTTTPRSGQGILNMKMRSDKLQAIFYIDFETGVSIYLMCSI